LPLLLLLLLLFSLQDVEAGKLAHSQALLFDIVDCP
jgi:hypothetical protein